MPNLSDNCKGCGPNDLRETRVSGRTSVEVPEDYLAEYLGPPQSQLAEALAVAEQLSERAAMPAFEQQPEAGVSSRGSQFTLAESGAADVAPGPGYNAPILASSRVVEHRNCSYRLAPARCPTGEAIVIEECDWYVNGKFQGRKWWAITTCMDLKRAQEMVAILNAL